jgi:hypothetical protein
MSPFTPDQIERLHKLSTEEASNVGFNERQHAEMADTADHVSFNPRQRAELTRRFRMRWLPILAYLLLTIGMAYAVGVSRQAADRQARVLQQAAIQHSNQNRTEATTITRRVTLNNCRADNNTRYVLRSILHSSVVNTRKLYREHLFTRAQRDRSLKLGLQAERLLASRDCQGIASAVH